MKLVDILARELKEWPQGKESASQDPDKEIRFFPGSNSDFYASILADDAGEDFGLGELVTRAQWQAARYAFISKKHISDADWSKSPEWASHILRSLCGEDKGKIYWSALIDGEHRTSPDGLFFHPNGYEVFQSRSEQEHTSVDAPKAGEQAWSGKGLPPVGTVCALSGPTEKLKPIHPEWAGKEVKIYSHFKSDRGLEMAAYVGVCQMIGGVGIADLFLPIRTAEQIAAEEREAEVDAMLALDTYPKGELAGGLMSRRSFCEALIAAGYRKQVQP